LHYFIDKIIEGMKGYLRQHSYFAVVVTFVAVAAVAAIYTHYTHMMAVNTRQDKEIGDAAAAATAAAAAARNARNNTIFWGVIGLIIAVLASVIVGVIAPVIIYHRPFRGVSTRTPTMNTIGNSIP
jgi:hypothetical protein